MWVIGYHWTTQNGNLQHLLKPTIRLSISAYKRGVQMLANWYQIIYIVSVKFLEGLLIKGSKIIVITVIELCNTFIPQIKGRCHCVNMWYCSGSGMRCMHWYIPLSCQLIYQCIYPVKTFHKFLKLFDRKETTSIYIYPPPTQYVTRFAKTRHNGT